MKKSQRRAGRWLTGMVATLGLVVAGSIHDPAPVAGQSIEAQVSLVDLSKMGDRSFGVLDRAFGGGYGASALVRVGRHTSVGMEWHRTRPSGGIDRVCAGLIDPMQCLPEPVETNSSYVGLRVGYDVEHDLGRHALISLRPALGLGGLNVTERGMDSGMKLAETDLAVLGGIEGAISLRPQGSWPAFRLSGGPDLIVPVSLGSCEDCTNYVEDRLIRLRVGLAVRF